MTAILPDDGHDTRWPRPLLALVAARAVNQLGGFALPFLAVALVAVYGASLATAGWVMASFGIATIPSRLVGGRLADRIGPRPTIVTGLVGCAVALLVIAASAGVPGAVLGAVLLGCAFEVYEPPSQALLAELVPSERRPQAYGLLGAALAVAGVLSGLLAVLLGGMDLRLLFVVDAATCLAAALAVLVCVTDPTPPAPGRGGLGHGAPGRGVPGTPWRDRRLLVMLGIGTGTALAWTLATIALPLTVAARGHDPADTGWLLAISAVVTVVGQRLLRGASPRAFTLMAAGLFLVAGGFAVIACADLLLLLGAGAALVALGQVLLLGPPYAVVAGLAEPASRARYLAAYGTCWGIAQTLGPVLATRLLHLGVPVPWLAGAALCLGLAAIQPAAARAVSAAT